MIYIDRLFFEYLVTKILFFSLSLTQYTGDPRQNIGENKKTQKKIESDKSAVT